MRESKGTNTVGITLRVDKRVYQEYCRLAADANQSEIAEGRPGRLTAQDVMRHRLYTLPSVERLLQT